MQTLEKFRALPKAPPLRWLITDKGDPDARAFVDGETFGGVHYSRQTIGARQFTRNGQNLVFMTADLRACWVTFRPTPGKASRTDGRDAWENALFKNEGAGLSSELIAEAVALSCALWGPLPPDGMITFIKPELTARKRSRHALPGQCYRWAGWVDERPASDGKPCLRAPVPEQLPWWAWHWKGDRGGRLRESLRT